jgi:hypothetical protein
MKLKGTLSQGICFPLSLLPPGKYNLDDDVTEIMGIVKYSADKEAELDDVKEVKSRHPIVKLMCKFKWFRQIFLSKKENKGFPAFISKTDETRLQNIPRVLQNKEIKYTVREKVDGQSGTFFLQRKKKMWPWQKESFDFGVCSRNLRLWSENLSQSQWFVAQRYNLQGVLLKLIGEHSFVAIQGECIASNVQGNKYKVTQPDLYVFNLIYPSGKVDCLEAEAILAEYGLKWCPLVAKDFVLLDTVNEM